MEQFEVIKAVSSILARTLADGVSEAVGHRVPVTFEYGPDARKGKGSLTLVHCELRTRPGKDDREYERLPDGSEQFRDRPLLLRSRYLLSAWATPPEDQALLGAALRILHDRPALDCKGPEEEAVVAYAGVPTATIDSLELAEHKLLADAYGMPLAPSMTYWVEYRLRSGKVTPIKRVLERVTDFRKIDG